MSEAAATADATTAAPTTTSATDAAFSKKAAAPISAARASSASTTYSGWEAKAVFDRGVQELKREGGLHPILSPTKLKVFLVCLSVCLSSSLSASLSASLPVFMPFYLPYACYGLSCFYIFFLSPFFLKIYSHLQSDTRGVC